MANYSFLTGTSGVDLQVSAQNQSVEYKATTATAIIPGPCHLLLEHPHLQMQSNKILILVDWIVPFVDSYKVEDLPLI